MLCCSICDRNFCSECDYLTVSIAKSCCNKAIDAYSEDNERKFKRREENKLQKSKLPKKFPYRKYKINIEEIENKGLL